MTIGELNRTCKNTLISHLEIEFTEYPKKRGLCPAKALTASQNTKAGSED